MPNRLQGQERAKLLLSNAFDTGRVQGSFLFYGPDGVGKFSKALEFAMILNCTSTEQKPCRVCNSCKKFLALSHPDFTYIFPTPNLKFQPDGTIGESKFLKEYEAFLHNKIDTPHKSFFFSAGTLIRIDAVHMLSHRLNMSASESRYKVCIIEDAHLMNQNAANAFLKILEEPPKDCVIILITSQKESLLPTIVSRCKGVPFAKLSWKVIASVLHKRYAVETEQAELYAKIADGNMARGIRLTKGFGLELRDLALKLLQVMSKGDDSAMSQMSADLGKSSVKNEMQVVLRYLSSFILDVYKLTLGAEQITNFDHLQLLRGIAQKDWRRSALFPDLVEYLDTIIKVSNLNYSLLLMVVYARYRGCGASYAGV